MTQFFLRMTVHCLNQQSHLQLVQMVNKEIGKVENWLRNDTLSLKYNKT